MRTGDRQRLFRLVGNAIRDYSMIRDGDRILLGLSGGKDSMLMVYLLENLRRRSPIRFVLEAITVDLGGDSTLKAKDTRAIADYLASLGVPHHVESTDIARIVRAHPSKDTACSLCSNLRRGVICKAAADRGCTSVALAHHLDDCIETFLLNLFYQSRIDCFDPSSYLTRQGITVIRPMVYLEERNVTSAVSEMGIPIIETDCILAHNTRRQTMKDLVGGLAPTVPNLHGHLRGALRKLWLGRRQPSRATSTTEG